MRWAARIIGVGGILFYLLCLYATWASPGFFNTFYIHSIVGIFLAATAVIALAGCIISWWREWLAGVLLIISLLPPSFFWLIAMVVMGRYYDYDDVSEWLGYGSPLPVAGLLFLLSWWLSRKTSPSALPSSTMS